MQKKLIALAVTGQLALGVEAGTGQGSGGAVPVVGGGLQAADVDRTPAAGQADRGLAIGMVHRALAIVAVDEARGVAQPKPSLSRLEP